MRLATTVGMTDLGRMTMSRTASIRLLVFCVCLIVEPCLCQTASQTTPPPSVTHFAGCVQRSTTDKDTIILSNETLCAKLTSTFPMEKVVGHEIDLKGVLTNGTASTPAAIRVGTITSIGKSCTDTCSLLPPGRRGLKKGELPGKEGGTPGMAPTKPQ
jgi:hypothetical protein